MPALRSHAFVRLALAIAVLCLATPLFAISITASNGGDWNDASIWSPQVVPGASDSVSIGTYPTSLPEAITVSLTRDESAGSLLLGDLNCLLATLDLGNSKLTVDHFSIGYYGGLGNIERGSGSFSASSLWIDRGNSLTFGNNDVVNSLYVYGNSEVTTTAAGNLTGYVSVGGGSKLTLGADITNAASISVDGDGTTLDMAGHSITAGQISLVYDGGPPTLQNRAALTAGRLMIGNQAFDLHAIDSVQDYRLSNASSTLYSPVSMLWLSNNSTATTTAAGNLTGYVSVGGGSKLTLGADITNAASISVDNYGSTLDMAGHSITAGQFGLGWGDGGLASVVNNGQMHVVTLLIGSGNTLTLHANDLIGSQVYLKNGSTLSVLQETGELTGLTLDGTSISNLSLDSTSLLSLQFSDSNQESWIFRWRDSDESSNWCDTLAGLISDGRIAINASHGYSIIDKSGYTYIESVPEPSTLALLVALGGMGIVVKLWRRPRA
jgi:hypothetical protein